MSAKPLGIPLRRYLTKFRSLELPQHFTDVLVIGGGVAGLSAALEASRFGRVAVVVKGEIDESNTRYAQGGIAAVLRPDDSIEEHVRDTLVAGAGLCREDVVRYVVLEGRDAIRELIQRGARFDVADDGELALTLEGGHSRRRVVHAHGDQTGLAVQQALAETVRASPGIRVHTNTFALDLLTKGGVCVGALIWDARQGTQVIWSRATILCTGGAGHVFRETTNPPVATGDGIAMALRAGAAIADMEFIQFHPTTLYVAGASRALISEAVRGEGAVLVDRNGVRFMEEEHPLGDLAPRDIVSRAIVRRMRSTSDTQVYLDATGIGAEEFRRRFPYISELCDAFDVDFTRDPIPVRPTAHYMIGGVASDLSTRTTLARLFAAGECACTTLHGANRLASNSLLEGAVFGKRAGREAGQSLAGQDPLPRPEAIEHTFEELHAHLPLDVQDLRSSLRATMTYFAGVERDGHGLEEALRRIQAWSRYALDRENRDPAGWELQNMLTVSVLIVRSALLREESRGVHFRRDFPDLDDAKWLQHAQITRGELIGEPPMPVD